MLIDSAGSINSRYVNFNEYGGDPRKTGAIETRHGLHEFAASTDSSVIAFGDSTCGVEPRPTVDATDCAPNFT